jgi:hypothetical protein
MNTNSHEFKSKTNLTMNKKLLLTFLFLATIVQSYAQSSCAGGMLLNDDFSSGLTSWTQFGTITTATVLPTGTGCLNNFLALQATNNSECGVEQPVVLKQDTCYELCYCYEFPQSGSLFNAKLVIAAITSGVTVNQVVTNTIPAGQGQILDFIASNTFIPPTSTCTAVFQATGNYTSIVIVNKTTGNIGTDVRVDNVCLTVTQLLETLLTLLTSPHLQLVLPYLGVGILGILRQVLIILLLCKILHILIPVQVLTLLVFTFLRLVQMDLPPVRIPFVLML